MMLRASWYNDEVASLDILVFASNGNNFKVNYAGGTGNDLTLEVVP